MQAGPELLERVFEQKIGFSQPLALGPGTQCGVATELAMEEDEGFQLERELLGELPGVRAFLVKLLRGRRDLEVEDLVQETVARALRYRRTFDPRRSLGPWLRRTAFRVFLDHRGRSQQEPSGDTLEPVAPAVELDGGLEQRESIQRLLRGLPPIEREILLRFHRDEESVREIARSLSLPLGTVKSHLHRARKRLATETPR